MEPLKKRLGRPPKNPPKRVFIKEDITIVEGSKWMMPQLPAPEGGTPVKIPTFLFLDNDCRKCVACNVRCPNAGKMVVRIQDTHHFAAFEKDGMRHYHYPGWSLLQYECLSCGYRWNVRTAYECICGWPHTTHE